MSRHIYKKKIHCWRFTKKINPAQITYKWEENKRNKIKIINITFTNLVVRKMC